MSPTHLMQRSSFSLAPKRRRRPVTKSSLGCVECKSRKIKCDETRPSCVRCSEKGMRCSGVATRPKIRWSTKHESYNHPETTPSREEDDSITRIFDAAWKSFSASQTPRLETCFTEVVFSRAHDHAENNSDMTGHEVNGAADGISESHPVSIQASTDDNPNRNLGCEPSNQIALSPWSLVSPTVFQPDPMGTSLASFDNRSSPILGSTFTYHERHGEAEHHTIEIPKSPQSPPSSPFVSQSPNQASLYDGISPLVAGVVDIQSELVGIYFTIVCPIFSTFDSEHNLFRSFVSARWQDSAAMFYAISSMAAAKISHELPTMKKQALEYQSLAISHLYADVSRASCWDVELLFIVLMLGLSTSWHVVTDLGISHLKAMQQAITEPAFQQTCDSRILRFLKEALVYWEMVICSVNDDVVVHDNLITDTSGSTPDSLHDDQTMRPTAPPCIMPHPWTGVAAAPQALFARASHRIRQARSSRRADPTPESLINHPDEFLKVLNELDDQLWQLKLPALHEIASTGDRNTPAIHHLLLAEAYMFATMYQLYYVFPNLRRRRVRLLREMSLNRSPLENSWAHDQARSWSSLLQPPCSSEWWVQFLGRNVILRLEQIQDTSGTCCVHALLLLVGSGSLSVLPELEGSRDAQEIFRVRRFVLDRLSQVSASKLSEPVCQVQSVILEIFRRLDLGLGVFWMEIMDAMGVVTIIG